MKEEQFLYLWKAPFYSVVIFCPESWALTLLPFKWPGNLPLLLSEDFVTVWRKEFPSFALWSWHAHFTLHLELFLSYLSTSIILRAKFSFSCYFFSGTTAATNLSPLSLSLIVYGVCKEHLGSEVLQKRMRKTKLDNRNNSRDTHPAVEQNEYQWKSYIKCMFLGIFRNKNGVDSMSTLLESETGDFWHLPMKHCRHSPRCFFCVNSAIGNLSLACILAFIFSALRWF